MSGHSKWSTIKRKKGAADAQRSKLWGKLLRFVEVAARDGGTIEANPTLATAVQKAKEASVPNDNIERAIKRGTGELEGESYEETSYEGYGPGGIAILVNCLTNNRNRAAQDVRSAFNGAGGKLAEPGAVSWMFEPKGVVLVPAAGRAPASPRRSWRRRYRSVTLTTRKGASTLAPDPATHSRCTLGGMIGNALEVVESVNILTNSHADARARVLAAPLRALCATRADAMSALLGTQPTLRQSPPIR